MLLSFNLLVFLIKLSDGGSYDYAMKCQYFPIVVVFV